jgi:hypothetical protein
MWARKHKRNINDIPVGGPALQLQHVKVQSAFYVAT